MDFEGSQPLETFQGIGNPGPQKSSGFFRGKFAPIFVKSCLTRFFFWGGNPFPSSMISGRKST